MCGSNGKDWFFHGSNEKQWQSGSVPIALNTLEVGWIQHKLAQPFLRTKHERYYIMLLSLFHTTTRQTTAVMRLRNCLPCHWSCEYHTWTFIAEYMYVCPGVQVLVHRGDDMGSEFSNRGRLASNKSRRGAAKCRVRRLAAGNWRLISWRIKTGATCRTYDVLWWMTYAYEGKLWRVWQTKDAAYDT